MVTCCLLLESLDIIFPSGLVFLCRMIFDTKVAPPVLGLTTRRMYIIGESTVHDYYLVVIMLTMDFVCTASC